MRVVLVALALAAGAALAIRREACPSRPRPEETRRRAEPRIEPVTPVAPARETVAPRRADDPSSEILAIHALSEDPSPDVEASLVARLHDERRAPVRLALILALERVGGAGALAEIERHVTPDDAHRAAAALVAIHEVSRRTAIEDRAWSMCDALLRSPELTNADPLFFAASRVRERPIELAVREFEDPSYPTAVREQARAWLAERRARPIDECGCGERPVPEGRVP